MHHTPIVFGTLTPSVDLLLLALLARFGSDSGRWGWPRLVFGRSPLCFYLAHLHLYDLIGHVRGPPGAGIAWMYLL
jgi:hypothetical protein